MGKTKIYREYANGKSGDVKSIKEEFLFRHNNELLPAEIFPRGGGLPTPHGFCALCWRPTEKLMAEMNLEVAKLDEGRKKESPIFGKYSPEISSPTASISYILEEENIDSATFNSMLLQAHFIMKKLSRAFKVASEHPTIDNRFEFEELLLQYAPSYIPLAVVGRPDQGLFELEKIRECVFQKLSLSHQMWNKLPVLTARRRPSSKFCSEHNQQNGIKARRQYQCDIKYENKFNAKIISVLERQGLVRKESLHIGEFEMRETFRITRCKMGQVRKEAYDSLNRSASSSKEQIINMNAEGKRQCEIAKELVERGLINEKTARQVVSNVLRRDKEKQGTIKKAKEMNCNGMQESEIAKKLNISSHTVTRLLGM